MSLTAGVINIPVRPDLSSFGSAVTTQSKSLFGTLGGGLSTLSKTLIAIPLAGAIVAGIGGAISAMGEMVQSAEDAESAQKVLKNTMRQMGDVSGTTAEALLAQNSALGLQVGIDDELITAGTSLLATFGHIRDMAGENNDIFTQANEIMVDYAATFTDGNMTTAATQLGKALNAGAVGAAALSRTGSIAAQDMAKLNKMNENGVSLLKQQKFILKAVGQQVEGNAKAGATATEKLTNAWEEFKEFLGGALLPVIRPLFRTITSGLKQLISHTHSVGEVWVKVWTQTKEWLTGTLWPALMSFWNGTVIPALKVAWDGFVEYVKSRFVDMLQSIGGSALRHLPGGSTIGPILDAVGLAEGGIVQRPTLAVVGEGKSNEAVVPLGRGNVMNVRLVNPSDVGDGGAAAAHMERIGRMSR